MCQSWHVPLNLQRCSTSYWKDLLQVFGMQKVKCEIRFIMINWLPNFAITLLHNRIILNHFFHHFSAVFPLARLQLPGCPWNVPRCGDHRKMSSGKTLLIFQHILCVPIVSWSLGADCIYECKTSSNLEFIPEFQPHITCLPRPVLSNCWLCARGLSNCIFSNQCCWKSQAMLAPQKLPLQEPQILH